MLKWLEESLIGIEIAVVGGVRHVRTHGDQDTRLGSDFYNWGSGISPSPPVVEVMGLCSNLFSEIEQEDLVQLVLGSVIFKRVTSDP